MLFSLSREILIPRILSVSQHTEMQLCDITINRNTKLYLAPYRKIISVIQRSEMYEFIKQRIPSFTTKTSNGFYFIFPPNIRMDMTRMPLGTFGNKNKIPCESNIFIHWNWPNRLLSHKLK